MAKKVVQSTKDFFLEVLPCFTCNSLKDRQVPVPAEVHRDAYRVSSFSHFASSQIQFLCVYSYFTLVYACMRVVHTYRHTCMHAYSNTYIVRTHARTYVQLLIMSQHTYEHVLFMFAYVYRWYAVNSC